MHDDSPDHQRQVLDMPRICGSCSSALTNIQSRTRLAVGARGQRHHHEVRYQCTNVPASELHKTTNGEAALSSRSWPPRSRSKALLSTSHRSISRPITPALAPHVVPLPPRTAAPILPQGRCSPPNPLPMYPHTRSPLLLLRRRRLLPAAPNSYPHLAAASVFSFRTAASATDTFTLP